MITLQAAYIKAKSAAERNGYTLLISCGDYGAFWGFSLMPPSYDPDNSYTIPNGSGEITVNKETGEIGEFAPQMDLDLFDKRKPVPIEQFGGLTRPTATAAKKPKRAAAVAAAS